MYIEKVLDLLSSAHEKWGQKSVVFTILFSVYIYIYIYIYIHTYTVYTYTVYIYTQNCSVGCGVKTFAIMIKR